MKPPSSFAPFSPLLIPLMFLGFSYLASILSGWRALSRRWPATRRRDPAAPWALETLVDWTWDYGTCIQVSVLDAGIHCQPRWRWSSRRTALLHPPLLVPWTDISEVRHAKDGDGDTIEVRAQTAGIDFRVRYPAELGFPIEHEPASSLERVAAPPPPSTLTA